MTDLCPDFWLVSSEHTDSRPLPQMEGPVLRPHPLHSSASHAGGNLSPELTYKTNSLSSSFRKLMVYTRSGLSSSQEWLSLRYLLVAIQSYYPVKHMCMPIFYREELGARQSLSEPCLAFYHFSCGLGFSFQGHCLISSSIWTQLLQPSWAQEHPGKLPVHRRNSNDFQDLMRDIKACSLLKSAAGFSNDIKNKGRQEVCY